MSRLQFRPEESGMQVPGYSPHPGGPALGKWTPAMSSFENQQCLYLGEPKGCGRLRLSSWKAHTQPHLFWVSGKAAAWAIGRSLTSFRMCARRILVELSPETEILVGTKFHAPTIRLSVGGCHVCHSPSTSPTSCTLYWRSLEICLMSPTGLDATSKGVPAPSHMVTIPEPLQCGSCWGRGPSPSKPGWWPWPAQVPPHQRGSHSGGQPHTPVYPE